MYLQHFKCSWASSSIVWSVILISSAFSLLIFTAFAWNNVLQLPVFFLLFFLSSGMTDFDNHLICWIEAVFFRSIHVRFDERIDISIPILRLMTIKFGKPLHIGQLTQVGLIKQVPVMSSLQDYARLVTYNEELLSRKPQDPLSRGRARSLYRLSTLYFHYIMTSATKRGRVVTCNEELPSTKSQDPLISWSCKVFWQIKYVCTTSMLMPIKLGKMMSCCKELPRIKSHNPLNTWSHEVACINTLSASGH